MLHQEVNRPATLALLHANEAVVRVAINLCTLRPHDEVAIVLIVVEWAAAGVVHASLPQVHEVANHIHDVGSVLHFVDDVLLDFSHETKNIM